MLAAHQLETVSLEDYLAKLLGASTSALTARIRKIAAGSCYITTDNGDPFLAVVVAPLHDFNAAEARLKDPLQNNDKAGLGILTDG